MAEMFKQIMLIFVILLAGSAWGVRAVLLSDLNSETSQDTKMAKSHELSDLKLPEHDTKTQKPLGFSVRNDKQAAFGDSNHPYKDFDVNEMFEFFFKPFQHLFEPNKKPKVKTVVSLTEVVGPKHPIMPGMQPFHPDQQLTSQFGVKEIGLMDDPFFDFGKIMHGFVPKISKVNVIMPAKHNHEKRSDFTSNLIDFDKAPYGHHHLLKSDLGFPRLNYLDEKSHNGQTFSIKGCNGESPLVSLGEIKLDEAEVINDENKDKMCTLIKALPYLEGAIGGVMFVMLILVIASWRIRKPNGIWARVPFIDKSQYVEKV